MVQRLSRAREDDFVENCVGHLKKLPYRIRHLSKKEHNVKLANVPLGIKASKRSMYKS